MKLHAVLFLGLLTAAQAGPRTSASYTIPADTADGTIEVPSHRYEIDLVAP